MKKRTMWILILLCLITIALMLIPTKAGASDGAPENVLFTFLENEMVCVTDYRDGQPYTACYCPCRTTCSPDYCTVYYYACGQDCGEYERQPTLIPTEEPQPTPYPTPVPPQPQELVVVEADCEKGWGNKYTFNALGGIMEYDYEEYYWVDPDVLEVVTFFGKHALEPTNCDSPEPTPIPTEEPQKPKCNCGGGNGGEDCNPNPNCDEKKNDKHDEK